MKTLQIGIVMLALAATAAGVGRAQQDDSDAAIIARWKAHALQMRNFTRFTDGEDITWQVMPYFRALVSMADALDGDRECLDTFCQAWEHLMSLASTDIDGLFGWPTTAGSYGVHGKRVIPMDDGIICEPVGMFVKYVNSKPELRQVYGERADRYLAFVEERIFPKWEASWLEVSGETDTVAWRGPDMQRAPLKLPETIGVYRFYEPGVKPVRTLPLNQFWHVAMCYLELYDATGKAGYLDKATKMARTGKHVYLERDGDRYRPWCYWRPVYSGDFQPNDEPVGWVGPHPERSSYAASETSMMARFHQRGIVFTDEDMQRLARLHLDFQWNGDVENPSFDYQYDRRRGYDKPYPVSLWSSLAPFDKRIAQMAARRRTRDTVAAAAGGWNGLSSVPAFIKAQRAGVVVP